MQTEVALLKKGELVAFPTETVYGLGARAFCPEAIEKIFAVKGRPADNPLIVHLSSLAQVTMVAREIPDRFYTLAEAFFPGPLTVILKKHPDLPPSITAGLDTVGVRMPAHPLAQALIAAVGEPLVAPSANLSGKPSSTCAAHVRADFEGKIAAILDGGPCTLGIESTVLLLEPQPTLLRPGSLSQEALEKVLGVAVERGERQGKSPQSPGMKYRHYAPEATVRLIEKPCSCAPHQRLIERLQPEELYAQLRAADLEGIEELLIVCTPQMRSNDALMNRLLRAASMC